jgi:hypothetical protein
MRRTSSPSLKLRAAGEVVRRLSRPTPGSDPADAATAPDLPAALRTLPPKLAVAPSYDS